MGLKFGSATRWTSLKRAYGSSGGYGARRLLYGRAGDWGFRRREARRNDAGAGRIPRHIAIPAFAYDGGASRISEPRRGAQAEIISAPRRVEARDSTSGVDL